MAKQCEARLEEGFRNQALVSSGSNVVGESESKPRAPPGLKYGGDRRIPRMDQPPKTKKEFDTDSVMTEKANPTQPQKVVESQAPPPITYSDSTQKMKTDQFPAQRLQTEPEATKQTQGKQTWGANDWDRNDWRAGYYSRGEPMPMCWGGDMPESQTQGSYTGAKSPQEWPNLRAILEGRLTLKVTGRQSLVENLLLGKCLY